MNGVWPSSKAAAFDAAMPGSNPATPAIYRRDKWRKDIKK